MAVRRITVMWTHSAASWSADLRDAAGALARLTSIGASRIMWKARSTRACCRCCLRCMGWRAGGGGGSWRHFSLSYSAALALAGAVIHVRRAELMRCSFSLPGMNQLNSPFRWVFATTLALVGAGGLRAAYPVRWRRANAAARHCVLGAGQRWLAGLALVSWLAAAIQADFVALRADARSSGGRNWPGRKSRVR